MIAVREDKLGIGIYSPAEAAFYARVQTRLLTRWMYGDAQGEPVVSPQIGDDERTVTFLDFVQALAIRNLRVNYNIGLSKIRQAVDNAKRLLDVEYPFAMRHTTYLCSDQKRAGHGELIIRIPGRDPDSDPKYLQLSGRSAGNYVFKEVVEVYLDDLSFDASQLAERYTAWRGRGGEVVMNPEIRFGEPYLPSCGYTAETLWEASIAEGGIEEAARVYGVSRDEVALACGFFDHLQGKPSV